MIFTALDDDPGGFRVLTGTFQDGEGSGEAHVQAPDGSIFQVEWTLLDGIHFQEVPIIQDIDDRTPWSKEDDEDLQSLFPDLQRVAEERRSLKHDPICDAIPDLERLWKAWRASQDV
jgi:hypothetical protein